MNWKKTTGIAIGLICSILSIVTFTNYQHGKLIKNEMNSHFNTERIQNLNNDVKSLSDDLKEITPHVKILLAEVPEIKKQIIRTNELLQKADFIVLKNQEDCPEDDEECDRLKVEQYVKRR